MVREDPPSVFLEDQPNAGWDVAFLAPSETREPSLRTSPVVDKVSKVGRAFMRRLAQCLPSRDRHCDIADTILSQVLTSRDFALGVIANRTYFGLDLLRLNRQDRHEFFEHYCLLFADVTSILYVELRRTQNVSERRGYIVPLDCRLLYFLFGDARTAYSLEAWRPIGEAMLEDMDKLVLRSPADPYNLPVGGDFEDRGRWDLPLCVGLHYFDVMVSAALYQGIEWHMWLFYFPYFAERIARNYAPIEALVDLNAEQPGIYGFLAHEMIRVLKSWVLAVGRVPANQSNVQRSRDHETLT